MPIPRLGGMAILAAYTISFLVLIASPLNGGLLVEHELGVVARLIPAVLLIFIVGVCDDILGLLAWHRLLGQLAAGGAAHAAGVTLHWIGSCALPGWAELPVSLVWLVVLTNAIDLIGGMDGLAIGLFAASTMLTAALLARNLPLAMATVPLAGARLGFLRYSFNPATIFLGDCRRLLIGFWLGCFGIIWS